MPAAPPAPRSRARIALVVALACGVAAAADPVTRPAQPRPDEPHPRPRQVRSRHFSFLTDVPDREATRILDTLERMTGLLERYFGRRQPGIIEGFVVHDLSVWPEGVLTEPLGVEKIREPAGVCFTTTLGPHRRATLYACDDPGIIRHECTHGFCHLAFGGVGPPWLAEGLAELGRWWREREKEVEVAPAVLALLHDPRVARPTIARIVAPETRPAEPRDYVWRWALCHFLVENPNYADRFRTLAPALMEGQPGASFEATFAPVARELAFEFDRFVADVGDGFRADLVAWPWKARQKRLTPGGIVRSKPKARAGWQSSGVEVEAGAVYVITAEGTWRTGAAEGIGPGGDDAGRGRLTGALFADYTLSEEIPIGAHVSWIAPADGVLMLRCADDWTALADNDGQVSVTIRRGAAP